MAKDPENRLYWRFNRQRMDAEQLRDSLLQVSGLLDTGKVGGESGEIDDPEFRRRAVYGRVSRFMLADYHKTFDFPNPTLSAAKRFVTSVPLQRLFFMNSDFVYEAAAQLAAKTAETPESIARAKAKAEKEAAEAKDAKTDDGKGDKTAKSEDAPKAEEEEAVQVPDDQRIKKAYALLFGRHPTPEEIAAGISFLSDEKNQLKPEKSDEEKAKEAEKTQTAATAGAATSALAGKPAPTVKPEGMEKKARDGEPEENPMKASVKGGKKADGDKKEKPPATAWILYARALLSSNEFLFVD